MILTGYAHTITQDITLDDIIAHPYATSSDPAILAAHCLEVVDPSLAEQVQEGDILIIAGQITQAAGGSASPETAVFALQALGISAVICVQSDAAFSQRAGELGLPVLIQREAATAIASGDLMRLDLERGTIEDQTGGTIWNCAPCLPKVLSAAQRTLLLIRMRRVVEDEGFAE